MVRTVIEIDEDRCNGCGLCVSGCHEGALQLIDGKARLVGDNLCDGLGACIGECPVGAIRFVDREATAYSEQEVLDRLIPMGENTVVAHLQHLKAHGQKDLVHEGFSILGSQGWDVSTLRSKVMGSAAGPQGGCPGSRVVMPPRSEVTLKTSSPQERPVSELRQWPVQLHLVPPTAPYLKNADLLVAADCVPFALASFHQDFLKDRILLIGCPKLDDLGYYAEKLTEIFALNTIRSVTVVRMEVPCCGGITRAVREAVAAAGKIVPYAEAVITIDGKLAPQG